MIDPPDTRVFAVGVSSYALGDAWRLPNASEHALAFALWAVRRGVPADRIHLFLSARDRQQFAPRLAAAGLEARPATFAAVTDFAFRELTTKDADLLYIFWSGHGSMSEDGARVLFFEDLTQNAPVAFDLNDFFARLRTSSFQRFGTQIAYVDACANRFEELGFDASLGDVRAGKGRYSYAGVRQSFFLAAESGDQALAGAFGAAVLGALADPARAREWPVDQDAIVAAVRPAFEKSGQHPVQLVWTTAEGDQRTIETAGEVPASGFVNAAAYTRRLPVRALRRLAEIASGSAGLGEASAAAAMRRDELYAALCLATGRAATPLPRGTPRVAMLYLVGAALQWNQEQLLAERLDLLAPAAEFSIELRRLALIQRVRAVVDTVRPSPADLRSEYVKTISRLSYEAARDEAATIDDMLDELYQISGSVDAERPVWEFLLRLANRFPNRRAGIDTFLQQEAPAGTLSALRDALRREQRFILSINLTPAHTDVPAVEGVDARLVIADTATVVHPFPPQSVAGWDDAERCVAEIVRKSREIVMSGYRLNEAALLVEFLVPAALLTAAPEEFRVRAQGTQHPVAALHPVVVRLRERIAERWEALHIEEWERAATRIDRNSACAVQWMDRTLQAPTIDTCNGLVALSFLPDSDVIEIVNQGFPFMAWLRDDPHTGDWAAFTARLEAWAGGQTVKQLAREVRAFRRAEPLGVRLVLLWDDPDQTGHWLRLDDLT